MALLRSPACAFVVVTAPAEGSLEEAGSFLDRLSASGLRSAAVVVNRWHAGNRFPARRAAGAAGRLARGDLERRTAAAVIRQRVREQPRRAAETQALAGFVGTHPGIPVFAVPDLPGDVQDVAGLRGIAAHLFGAEDRAVEAGLRR